MTESDPSELFSAIPPVITDPPYIQKPRVWPVFVIFFLALVLEIVVESVFMLALVVREHGWDLTPEIILNAAKSTVGLLGGASLGLLISGGAAIVAALLSPVPWRERLRLRPVRIGVLSLIAACVGVLAVSLVIQGFDTLHWLPHSVTLEAIDGAIRGLSGIRLLAAVVVIGIAPGIAEELLFRGYMQTRFSERWGANWGIVVTAVMFGAMHMDLVQSPYAMLIGLLLGFMAERTGSIVPGMIVHAVNNTVGTLLSASNAGSDGGMNALLSLSIGTVLVAASVFYLWRKLPSPSRT